MSRPNSHHAKRRILQLFAFPEMKRLASTVGSIGNTSSQRKKRNSLGLKSFRISSRRLGNAFNLQAGGPSRSPGRAHKPIMHTRCIACAWSDSFLDCSMGMHVMATLKASFVYLSTSWQFCGLRVLVSKSIWSAALEKLLCNWCSQ